MKYVETPHGVKYSQGKDKRGMHRIRWADPATGRHRDARRKTFDDARALAFELDATLVRQGKRGNGRAHHDATIAELVEHYLHPDNRGKDWAVRHALNQTNYARNHVAGAIGHVPCRDWTAVETIEVLRSCAHLAPSTRSGLYTCMGAIARHGRRHGFLEHDPVADVDTPKGGGNRLIDSDTLPTEPDIDRLANAMVALRDEWWRDLQVRIAARMGLRAGEMHGLHVDDVNLDKGYLRVVRQAQYEPGGGIILKPPKHRTADDPARRVPIPEWLDEPLSRRLRELDGPIVFPSPLGGLQNHNSFLQSRFYPAARAAGWYIGDELRWTWHDLRHVFCTWALSVDGLNLDPADVAGFAGHHSPAYTYAKYVGRSAGAIERARAAGRDGRPQLRAV